METRSKYYRRLGSLLKRPSFTAAEARALGVSSRVLGYLVDRGLLERLSRGIYRSSDHEPEVDITLEGLAFAASTIPNGVICLISALAYYEMTDEVPREHWIAIPHSAHLAKRPFTRVVQMRNMKLGIESAQLGEHNVMIFDRERCVVDAFRYLSREVAIKALRAYLEDSENKTDLQKLARYAKELRVKMRPYILALTT